MVRTFLGRVQNKQRPQLLTSDGTRYTPTFGFTRAMTPADSLDTVFGQYGLEYNTQATMRQTRQPTGHNFIRNPRGEGAGAMPDIWSLNAANGFTVTKVGSGVDADGYAWTDLRYVTASSLAVGFVRVLIDVAVALPLFDNEQLAFRMYVKVMNVTTADGAFSHRNVISLAPSGGTTSTSLTNLQNRIGEDWNARENTATCPVGVTSGNIGFDITMPSVAGQVYDFTIRIANPQLELGTSCGDRSLPPPGTQDMSVAFTRPRTPIMNATTNRIWNPRFEGAVAGSPGTVPTYWLTVGSPVNGISRTISLGTETGIPYIDLRWAGTATAGTNLWHVLTATTHGLSAPTSTFNLGLNMRLVGGTISGWDTIRIGIEDYDSVPVMITSAFTDYKSNLSRLPLAFQRYYQTITTGATSATIRPVLSFTCSIGAVVDITLRIAMPMLEGPYRTTPLFPPVGAPQAVVRGPEVYRLSGFIKDYRQGTILMNFMIPYLGPSNLSVFEINDNSSNNEIFLYIISSGASFLLSTGNPTITTPGGTFAANTSHKVAVSWMNGGEIVMASNGVIRGRQAFTSAGPMDRVHIGSRLSSFIHNALIESVNYYPSPLGDATLIELTT